MAILDQHPGLHFTVKVNDEPLREHADPEAEKSDNIITKYIEVKTNNIFEVVVNFLEATHGVTIAIQLDGVQVASCIMRLEDLKTDRGHKF
jgi:hypothetical protein